ncbi:MAG TPA: hypothetical protein VF629_23440 [Hymenobacter sp.]|uniref:hypothetical protein n=1 Tax=Hymenobacter sp. TaxID=1898978 RepID=UPI002ED848F6
MAHLAWRADSPEALEDAVEHLESIGAGIGWVDGDLGHGRAYRFHSPDGHVHEIFWDVTWLRETGARGSVFADRYASNRRRGMSPRRFDHVTLFTTKYPAEKAFWKAMGLKNPDEVRITDEIPPWAACLPPATCRTTSPFSPTRRARRARAPSTTWLGTSTRARKCCWRATG